MKDRPISNPGDRILQLDGLRCFAVLAVIWFHWAQPPYNGNFLKTSLGEIGVSVFFVLSGFLISKTLLDAKSKAESHKNKSSAIKTFYLRRFLRIFPLYYATLAILFILNIPPHREAIGWHVLYLQNIYHKLTTPHIWGSHFWTLAVEEQFYLVWPFILILVEKKHFVRIFSCLIVSSLIYRMLWLMLPHWLPSPSRLLIDHLDCFATGAYFSYLSTLSAPEPRQKAARAFWITGLFLFILSQTDIPGAFALTQTAVAFLCGALVSYTSTGISGRVGRILDNKIVVYIGSISYGLYIFHALAPAFWLWFFWTCPLPGYRLFARLGLPAEMLNSYWFQIFVNVLITATLSILSWHFFEKPIISLKSRLKQT